MLAPQDLFNDDGGSPGNSCCTTALVGGAEMVVYHRKYGHEKTGLCSWLAGFLQDSATCFIE